MNDESLMCAVLLARHFGNNNIRYHLISDSVVVQLDAIRRR